MNFLDYLRDRPRRSRRHYLWFVIVVAVLVVFRLSLPFAVKAYVNRRLNEAHGFGGRVSQIDIQLWRGQYRIHSIVIFKKSAGGQVPFFSSRRVNLSIEWRELFHGSVVGQVLMDQPRLNFISGPPSEETLESGKNEDWNKMLASLFPFNLNRVEIGDGQIHFQNPYSKPPVDIYLNGVSATATNLTNTRDLKEALPAGVAAKGTTIGGGGFDIQLQLNPLTPAPTFQLACQLTNVDLTSLNDFLKAYGKFDVDHGDFALFTSVAASDGNYQGYLKVFFKDLKVFEWDKERKKNALEVFWQAIVGTLTTVFKNQRTDTLATRIPISGSYGKNNVAIWPTVATLLRNAFIRALIPGIDAPVTLKQVDQKDDKKAGIMQNDGRALEKNGAQKQVPGNPPSSESGSAAR